jgi:hypothetical protein
MNEAIKWFRMAAEQGIPEAQFNIGFCYGNGDGVSQSGLANLISPLWGYRF